METILPGHEGWVNDVKWIIMNNKINLITCSSDKMIIIWEQMEDQNNFIWNEKFRFGEVGENATSFLSCSFSKIDQNLIIIAYSFHGAIHFWKSSDNWQSGTPITGHFNEITDLTWEPEGQYFLTCSLDQTTRLHSKWIINNSWHEIARPQIHGYDINSISMIDRLKFVSGADEKVIRVLTTTKNFIESLSNVTQIKLDNSGDKFAECAVIPSLGLSNSAVYDTSTIEDDFKPKTIDCPPSEEILIQNTLWSETQKLYGHGYDIFRVAVNHSGTLLASACKASKSNDASIILWDLKNYKKIANLFSHNLTVTQMRFSPNDQFLLSVSRDRSWAIFEMKTSKYERVAFSDKKSGIHNRIIWDCAWTFDSKYFLTTSRDKSAIVWQINNFDDFQQNDNCKELEIKANQPIVFDCPATSIDVHEKFINENYHLVALGFENGNLSLYSLTIPLLQWQEIYKFESFWYDFD